MTRGLLLLHGFTGGPSTWDVVSAEIQRSFDIEVLSPCLVGHGDAVDSPVGGFEAEIDRIASLMTSVRSWHVAGYSLGGRLALGLMVRHGALLTGATLIGAQPGLASEADRSARRSADERWCSLLKQAPLADFVAEWEAQPLFASQGRLPSDLRERIRAERLRQSPDGLARSLRVTGLGAMPSYWDALGGITIPTTLMAGSDDEKFSKIAAEMVARMPAAKLEITHGAGHNVVVERPETVRAVIERALRGEST